MLRCAAMRTCLECLAGLLLVTSVYAPPGGVPSAGASPAPAQPLLFEEEPLPRELTPNGRDLLTRYAIPKAVSDTPIPVVEESALSVRVLLTDAGVSLSLAFPPSRFYLLSAEDTEIRPDADPASFAKYGARIRLAHGMPLVKLDKDLEKHSNHFNYDADGLRIRGVLHAPSRAYSYTDDPPKWAEGERPWSEGQGIGLELVLPRAVRASPGGAPFVWLSMDDDIVVNEVVRSSNGDVLVSLLLQLDIEPFFIGGANIEIQGWVPANTLRPTRSAFYGRGRGSLAGHLPIFRNKGILLPPGARFYDRPNGRIVGVVTGQELRFPPVASAGAWRAVTVRHRLGRDTLWVRKQ